MRRISFNEITQNAVKASLKAAARYRYESCQTHSRPDVFWTVWWVTRSARFCGQKVKRGLSAGRVQSVALRIICDREDEINAFIPEEYWTLDAKLKADGEKKPLTAKFHGDENGKLAIHLPRGGWTVSWTRSAESGYEVLEVKKGERVKKAPLPFTTSTLQQEASKTLNFPISEDDASCPAAL